MIAPATRGVAPPGKIFIFRPLLALLEPQANAAKHQLARQEQNADADHGFIHLVIDGRTGRRNIDRAATRCA